MPAQPPVPPSACLPEPIPAPRGVCFDLDGLLVNTEELYQDVGTELLRRRGKPFEPELLDRMMGRPQRVSLRIMIEWHALDDSVETLAQETGEIFRSLLETRLKPMPGAVALIDSLTASAVPFGVATSSGPDFAHDVLGRVGLLERMGFVLTCDDVTEGKPHPEIYLAASGRLGVPPQRMLVLEDSHNGCRAAVAAGAVAVAVPGGHSHRHDFPGAAFIAASLADPRIYAALGLAAAESS
ncbi:MAG: HAD family phosphatase [Planctomycetota bacterium]|nr:MAG: HAD family phosphatase [Planctomycetota bacterium]